MNQPKAESATGKALAACRATIARFAGEQSGASFLFAALALPIILGAAGLGFDATIWYLTKRQNQSIADNAVLAATVALTRDPGASQSALENEAWTAANRDGFQSSTAQRITVNSPPAAGTYAGDPGYVEIVVEEDRPLYLTSFVMNSQTLTVQARAVAGVTSAGEHCLVALDPRANAALEFTGTANVIMNCGVASNSISEQAILVNGNADLQADPAQAVGDILVTGSGTFNTSTPPQPHSLPVPDPYAGVSLPAAAGLTCDYNNYAAKNETLDPGVYCGGLDIKFTVDLNPGVYVINEGDLSISANADVNGSEVTIIFVADQPANVGGISNINGNANVTLTAPGPGGHSTGPYQNEYAGMLFMQHPDAASTGVNRLNGGASMQLSGALYFPSQEVNYTGNSDQTNGCIKIVGRKLTFSGASDLNADAANCAAQGVAEIAQTRVRVVE